MCFTSRPWSLRGEWVYSAKIKFYALLNKHFKTTVDILLGLLILSILLLLFVIVLILLDNLSSSGVPPSQALESSREELRDAMTWVVLKWVATGLQASTSTVKLITSSQVFQTKHHDLTCISHGL